MSDCVDLSILDSGTPPNPVVLARSDNDLAVARVPSAAIAALTDFRRRLVGLTQGAYVQISAAQMERFGRDLFDFAIRGDVRRLYDRLPAKHVRIRLLSDHPDLQALPWEFLIEPGRPSAPRLERSIVRIVPTIGAATPPPKPLSDTVRVLFVWADPSDQAAVDWPNVKASIEQIFAAQMPDRFTLTAIEGTRAAVIKALQTEPFDIFHFSGHGVVDASGMGQLALKTKKGASSYLSATDVLTMLSGRDVRLAVLSACDTSAGNFASDFAVMASTLVAGGIPAVVANQLPVLDSTVAVFVGALYDQLLISGDIDLAVGEGRIRLFTQLASSPTGRAAVEWGIPTLYRHFGASQLFQP